MIQAKLNQSRDESIIIDSLRSEQKNIQNTVQDRFIPCFLRTL